MNTASRIASLTALLVAIVALILSMPRESRESYADLIRDKGLANRCVPTLKGKFPMLDCDDCVRTEFNQELTGRNMHTKRFDVHGSGDLVIRSNTNDRISLQDTHASAAEHKRKLASITKSASDKQQKIRAMNAMIKDQYL